MPTLRTGPAAAGAATRGSWPARCWPPPAAAASGRGHLWDLVRRLARDAGIEGWDQLSPHCLRHSAITFALDAGATLRDVQARRQLT